MRLSEIRVVAGIQARVSSSRFPGKILRDFQGIPLIVYMYRRVVRSKSICKTVILTSSDPTDDALIAVLEQYSIPYFRGPLADVLQRYYQFSLTAAATHMVRLTGDCPLIDHRIIDQCVSVLLEGYDYVSNICPPTYPDGLDVEVFTVELLERLNQKVLSDEHREHVTLAVRDQSVAAKTGNVQFKKDYSEYRWTVDYPEDLSYLNNLITGPFRDSSIDFSFEDIIRDSDPAILDRRTELKRNESLISLVKF